MRRSQTSSTARVGALLLLLGLGVVAAFAHTIQITGVKVEIENDQTTVSVVAHLPLLKGVDPHTSIPPRIHLLLGGKPFQPEGATVDWDRDLDLVTWKGHQRGTASSVKFESPIFPDQADDTTVILVYRDGKLVDRSALTPSHPSAIIGENSYAVILRFIEEGISHIFNGPDHILFVLGLIIVGGKVRQLLSVVTAFTIAHSITLSLTALGISSLAPRYVEPLIALSIVAVGVENLIRKGADAELRVWIAFGFGFFHGFGFAGALAEVGLPRQALAWSLASFNIGVEIAQACIVLLTVPLLEFLRRRNQDWSFMVVRAGSAIIAAAGVFWFVERVISYKYF